MIAFTKKAEMIPILDGFVGRTVVVLCGGGGRYSEWKGLSLEITGILKNSTYGLLNGPQTTSHWYILNADSYFLFRIEKVLAVEQHRDYSPIVNGETLGISVNIWGFFG